MKVYSFKKTFSEFGIINNDHSFETYQRDLSMDDIQKMDGVYDIILEKNYQRVGVSFQKKLI
jgi:hypothetical protein